MTAVVAQRPGFLSRLFGRRMALPMERAREPIPFHADTFIGMNSSGSPTSGVLLQEADGIPAIATRAIADRIATLDWEVVVQRRVSNGTVEEEVLDDHPLKLLLDSPSPTHSAVQTRRLIAQHIVTVGEGYLLKVGSGKLAEALYVMLPDRINPVASQGIITGYQVTSGQGAQQIIDAREVVRIWNPDPATLYTARGILGPQGTAADTLKFQAQHLRSHYETNAVPPVVIEGQAGGNAPDAATRERFDAGWLSSYHRRFGTKRGLPAWIPPGWTSKVLDAHGGDTEILGLMEFHRDQVLMAYGVPPSVLGQVRSGDRSSAETNQFVFDLHTITPITTMIGDALTVQLAQDYPQPQGTRLIVRFVKFVSDDEKLRLLEEDQDLKLKVRSINKVLEDRGEDPVPWGDLPVGSFSDQPYTGEEPMPPAPADVPPSIGDANAPTPQAASQDGVKPPRSRERNVSYQRAEWARFMARERRWVPTFTGKMQRVFAIQRDRCLERLNGMRSRQQREIVKVLDLFSPSEWARLFRVVIAPVRKAAFIASGEEAMAEVAPGKRFIFTDTIASKLETDGQAFEEWTNATTARKLEKTLAEAARNGESIDTIATRVQDVFSTRRKQAVMIARTEMAAATQAAQTEGFKQSGVIERQEWNSSLDDRVRDSHQIDGQVVTLGDTFDLGDGEQARFPADPNLPPEDRINCRCFLTPVID